MPTTGKAQGGGLFDTHANPFDTRIAQAKPGDLVGHPLDQKKPGILDQVNDVLADRPVVDRVANVVGTSRRSRVDVNSEINAHVLLCSRARRR